MYTRIELKAGVMTLKIVSNEDAEISEKRWRASIRPAITFLHSQGGGTFIVPHDLSELAP